MHGVQDARYNAMYICMNDDTTKCMWRYTESAVDLSNFVISYNVRNRVKYRIINFFALFILSRH